MKKLFLLLILLNAIGLTYSQQGKSSFKEVNISKTPKPKAPANLEVTDIIFSDKNGNANDIIDASENTDIKFTVKNTGKGDAYNVIAEIKEKNSIRGLDFPNKLLIGQIKANDYIQKIIRINSSMDLQSGIAKFEIKITEANGFDAELTTINVKTQEFLAPKLILADYIFTSEESGKIKLGKTINLKLVIQNQGQGKANNIVISFHNPQNVFPTDKTIYEYSSLFPNETVIINYEFFTNKQYIGKEIAIELTITEEYGKYGETRSFKVSLDEELTKTEKQIDINGISHKTVQITNVSLLSDVDKNIPENHLVKSNCYALIIGNEDYSSYQNGLNKEQNVDFAINDALIFKEYLIKTLGVPEKQINFIKNGTIGNINQGIAWINNLAKVENGNAELIFYYSGHGLPDEETKEAYIIPVDVSGKNIKEGIKLNNIYSKLTEYTSKRITVFLDACFSGGARNQGLVAMKGIKIKPKENQISGNMLVFTSSSGEESSGIYREKQHGFMTYYLLKRIQETKGETSYKELKEYLIRNVSKESSLISKPQTPQVLVSPEIEGKWENWKLR